MKRIIHTETGATLWRGEEYLVDGKPGTVDLPAVILEEMETAPPEYDPATQRLDIEPPVADMAAGQWIARSWQVRDLTAEEIAALAPPVAEITKLTLMQRLSALGKWAEFKGILTQLPSDAQDAWDLALSIRADDPIFVAYAPTIKAALELDDETFSGLLMP